jgi:hypothetical protein
MTMLFALYDGNDTILYAYRFFLPGFEVITEGVQCEC